MNTVNDQLPRDTRQPSLTRFLHIHHYRQSGVNLLGRESFDGNKSITGTNMVDSTAARKRTRMPVAQVMEQMTSLDTLSREALARLPQNKQGISAAVGSYGFALDFTYTNESSSSVHCDLHAITDFV